MSGHPTVRNLAVSQIVSDTMEELGMSFPKQSVDLADIRRKYHAAEQEEEKGEGMSEHAIQPSMIEIRSLFYEKQSLFRLDSLFRFLGNLTLSSPNIIGLPHGYVLMRR